MKEYNKPTQSYKLSSAHGLYGDDPLATVRLPQRSLSSQSLGKYNDNLTITTKRQNTY